MPNIRRGLLVLFAAAAVCAGRPAAAQGKFQVLGPNECINCHDHDAEKTWSQKQEIAEVQKLFPKQGNNAGHINSLKQLEAGKSNDYAKAVGLKDKYDVNGSCVRCHGTVFKGDANAGVSCESCHGPASGYLKPHQTKGAYSSSLSVGMIDLVGKVPAWVQQCTSCHVVDDPKLIAAGHPSGDDFDLGTKYAPVALHFKKKYSAGDVSAIGKQMVAAIVAKRRGGAAPAVAAAAPAPTPVPPAATPAPATAAVPPRPTPAAPPASAPPAPAAATTSPARPAAPPPAAPPVQTRPTPPPVAVTATNNVAPPPVAPAAPSAAPPAVAAAAAAPAPSFSSLSGALALVQGRLILALTGALQSGASAPTRTSTPPPALTPYSGPDAALLQLQREAIELALEALGTAPAAPATTPSR